MVNICTVQYSSHLPAHPSVMRLAEMKNILKWCLWLSVYLTIEIIDPKEMGVLPMNLMMENHVPPEWDLVSQKGKEISHGSNNMSDQLTG